MLTSIEVRLEECTAIADTMPPELVSEAEEGGGEWGGKGRGEEG
jgi:hypothetical protein